jgi:hypothetical protein
MKNEKDWLKEMIDLSDGRYNEVYDGILNRLAELEAEEQRDKDELCEECKEPVKYHRALTLQCPTEDDNGWLDTVFTPKKQESVEMMEPYIKDVEKLIKKLEGKKAWEIEEMGIDYREIKLNPVTYHYRVLPADKIVRVLVDGGWVPDGRGDFCKNYTVCFNTGMWESCGNLLDKNMRDDKGYHYLPEWCEKEEVKDA